MTILIVDDEPLSVDGIAASLPWEALSIDHVLKAYSSEQAKKLFSQQQIDILLSDIEMPRGGGIELVQWVREKKFDTLCIFLTSYSRFEYASSAIKLQIFDYVLKPCEYEKLTEVIRSACTKVNEDSKKRKKEQSGEYWIDSYQTILNQFWHGILLNETPSNYDFIKKELKRHHLDNSLLDKKYYMLLIILFPDEQMSDPEDDSLWKYALGNIANEVISSTPVLSIDNIFSFIIPTEQFPNEDAFFLSCKNLIDTLHQIIPAEFIGYCAPACQITEINALGQTLRVSFADKYVLNSTLFITGRFYTPHKHPKFSETDWQNALMTNMPEKIINDIINYFSMPCYNHYFNSESIQQIYHLLLRIIYNVLALNNLSIPQSLIAVDQESQKVVYRSIHAFLQWIKKVVHEVSALIASREYTSSVIGILTEYIHNNLNNDLSRSELTKVVHLHPDYLSSYFHQKTGLSLSEYITNERLKEARKLLLSTNLPVNEVALRTGFPNISYFSKIFKDFEGTTPLQFRKQKSV